MNLAGEVAVVTGASSGLGREVGVALASAGADVALFARGGSGLSGSAETGGDSMDEAVRLVMRLVAHECLTTGEFCWPENMQVAQPLPTWSR